MLGGNYPSTDSRIWASQKEDACQEHFVRSLCSATKSPVEPLHASFHVGQLGVKDSLLKHLLVAVVL